MADPGRIQRLMKASDLSLLLRTQDTRLAVVEVGYERVDEYEREHIPGALFLDTIRIEAPPLWNLRCLKDIRLAFADLGISVDSHERVVLYSRDCLSMYRVFFALLCCQFSNCYVLDGGWAAWKGRGVAADPASCTRRTHSDMPCRDASWDRAADAPFPESPLVASLAYVKDNLSRKDFQLVSIRSLEEHMGVTSGYQDIAAKGDIAGAVWGHGGPNANHLDEYFNEDMTLRPIADILSLWEQCQLSKDCEVVFYCGTGWRASVAFFVAWVCCWPRLRLFDGGWLEWSLAHSAD
jgi:3-mercaptopyruvate sulfurtransferase SseA